MPLRTLLLATILGAGVLLAGPLHAAQQEPAALTVSITKPVERAWSRTVPASGWLKPWQEAVVASAVDGLKVIDILADVGATVREGQPLVRLADEAVRAELRKEEALAAGARADLAKATSNADRARRVQPTGAISEEKINEYLIAEQTAVAALDSAMASVESARIKLQRTVVTAPDDGIVTSRTAQLGTVVASGTELFRLQRQSRVEWQAEIPAKYLPLVQEGMAAAIDGEDGREIGGKVRLVAPTVNTDTGRALVYVALPAGTKSTLGLHATGRIELDSTVALTVPETALVVRDGFTYVFTLDADSRVERTRVETGRRSGRDVEIVSGLAKSADVVSRGGAFLSDRAVVRIDGSAVALAEGTAK